MLSRFPEAPTTATDRGDKRIDRSWALFRGWTMASGAFTRNSHHKGGAEAVNSDLDVVAGE